MAKKMSKKRTSKGNITSEERSRTGMKGSGKYPMPDEAACISAVKLRHNGKGVTAAAVLSKASRAANANNWGRCKAAIEKAREVDRK